MVTGRLEVLSSKADDGSSCSRAAESVCSLHYVPHGSMERELLRRPTVRVRARSTQGTLPFLDRRLCAQVNQGKGEISTPPTLCG